jgi:hypothetical protein
MEEIVDIQEVHCPHTSTPPENKVVGYINFLASAHAPRVEKETLKA